MSVTVTGFPFLLLSIVAPSAIEALENIDREFVSNTRKMLEDSNSFSYSMGEENANQKQCAEENFLERNIQTQIVDKDTLIKTLTEYGAEVTVEKEYKLQARCENFIMTFEKDNDELPYTVNIKYSPADFPENMMNDISEEYTKNAQEISYNKIKERLEQKNLEINEEEVLEDDTIVLTINLE